MRFFLISDNSDAMNGLRLAGIEGTVARSEADLRKALENAANHPAAGGGGEKTVFVQTQGGCDQVSYGGIVLHHQDQRFIHALSPLLSAG